MHGNELHMLWAKAFSIVGTIFYVFSYDAVSGRDPNISPVADVSLKVILSRPLIRWL